MAAEAHIQVHAETVMGYTFAPDYPAQYNGRWRCLPLVGEEPIGEFLAKCLKHITVQPVPMHPNRCTRRERLQQVRMIIDWTHAVGSLTTEEYDLWLSRVHAL